MGGILLGVDPLGGAPIEVTVAGDPGPAALRTPHRFVRDRDHAERLADAAYRQGGSTWVGEWHTHPTGSPRPSPTDITTYAAFLREPGLAFERLAAVIATPLSTDWVRTMLWAWLVEPGGVTPAAIAITEDRETTER